MSNTRTTNTSSSPSKPRTASPLETAIATVAAELSDDAATLADFATSFAHDVKGGQ